MTKFVHITDMGKVPEKLEKGEIIIRSPSFIDEVRAMMPMKPSVNQTTAHFLRMIAVEIGKRYDPNFNAYRHIVVSDYTGIPFETVEQLAVVVRRMMLATYPNIVEKYLEKKIKERPLNTKLIWFFGSWNETRAFTREAIEHIELSEVDAYMGRKKAKKEEKKE